MKFSVLTLFPDMIRASLETSIIGKALSKGLFELDTIQIRDFAVNSYGKVDDYLFGGGKGMLMMAEPVYQAWHEAMSADMTDTTKVLDKSNELLQEKSVRTVYMSPKGKQFNQKTAARLSRYDNLIILCGHYEGIDQRVIDEIVDEEISMGDFVMTGGELAACSVIDSIARLLPGVLPTEEVYINESHMNGLLEQPHYTRPAKWRGKKVPEILLSGHQAKIERWQYLNSLIDTLERRPDLLNYADITRKDWLEVIELIKTRKTMMDSN